MTIRTLFLIKKNHTTKFHAWNAGAGRPCNIRRFRSTHTPIVKALVNTL